MADPLTSSDMLNIERGSGPSVMASTEERRRFAAAGELPLNSMDVVKFAEGRGISPMAGTEDKAAWKMAEYMSGRREQAPVEYGGIGDRPDGSSRRAIRMQDEWDKKQADLLNQQRIMQQMDLEQKQFEMGQRDQQMQEDDFYYNRGLKEAEQKLQAQQLSEATSIISGLNQLDPRDPEYQKKRSAIFGNNPLGASDPNVQKVANEYGAANEVYGNAMKEQATGIREAQEKYATDMQNLMEAGVTEEELPQYINPKSPVGLPMFDPLKMAAKLGTTKAQEKAEAKTTKEETPKEKIGLDLQQAYGELNALLLSGEDNAAAGSKVAGLRARYKAATGEEAPEVLPELKTREEYDRIPAGTSYIGKDGKKRIKQ